MIDQVIRRALEEIVKKQRPCFITIEIQAIEQGHRLCASSNKICYFPFTVIVPRLNLGGMFPYHTPIASSYVPVDSVDSPVREL
ncbi:hypothetical protein AARAC_010861 [Aspergillus arachidicola]|uniref:Uncharacterized protein n=1 Tax=Aspergillus arachidicola TaxID=656916 RepID=A0A2G7FQ77_9EURO|nr:hypothetical protein AARAC_010861 [Aspergillus arachidicola]